MDTTTDPPVGTTQEPISTIEIERLSLVRLLRLYRQTDDLDTATQTAIEPALSRTLTEDSNMRCKDDVEYMILLLPDCNRLMTPGFFNRIGFPFRMLQRCLKIHNIDPVSEHFLQYFDLEDKDMRNKSLHERIWFLLFIGASSDIVKDLLRKYW